MNLALTIDLFCGGPGSGCNPEVGKCGRPSLGEYNISEKKFTVLNKDQIRVPDFNPLATAAEIWSGNGFRTMRMVLAERAGTPIYMKPADSEKQTPEYKEATLKYALLLVDKLNKAPVVDQSLYRGISVTKSFQSVDKTIKEVESLFKPGTEFDEPLASFSKDRSVAEDFAAAGDVSVVFVMEKGKGLDVSKIAGRYNPVNASEQEVISGGRFKVTQAKKRRGYHESELLEVRLQQLDTFDVSMK